MWLFNSLPKSLLKDKHKFEATEQWTKHLMLSSVRFNSGGSASFISSNGLVLTNHHVASETLYKLSTPNETSTDDGYYAKSQADELKAPDLELNQLVSIEDVTAQVNAAVKPGMDAVAASKARRAAMAEIEQKSKEQTSCEVTSSLCMAVDATTSIATNNTPTSVSFGLQRQLPHSSAAMQTTSNTLATAWT